MNSPLYRSISNNLFNNDNGVFHTYARYDEEVSAPESEVDEIRRSDEEIVSQEQQTRRNIEKVILGLDKNSINVFKNQTIDTELEYKLLEALNLRRPNGEISKIKEKAANDFYLKSMKKTFFDKCFFIPFIPKDQLKILFVDFGCADGSLCSYAKNLFPANTDMVGIENNSEYLKLAVDNKDLKCAYKNVIEFDEEFDRSEYTYIHLNFSSVLHEIASEVGNATEIINYIIKTIHPDSISIRDMSLSTISNKFNDKLIDKIITSNNIHTNMITTCTELQRSNSYFKFNCLMYDIFQQSTFKEKFFLYTTLYRNFQTGTLPFTYEFLLKYFYDITQCHNEFKENYFNINLDIDNILSNLSLIDIYEISHCRKYTPSFLRNKWNVDFRQCAKFDILMDNITTHYDLFLVKCPERNNERSR